MFIGGDQEPFEIFRGQIDAEGAHHGQRHRDVGLRNQLAFDLQLDGLRRVGRGHQQAAEKLAGD